MIDNRKAKVGQGWCVVCVCTPSAADLFSSPRLISSASLSHYLSRIQPSVALLARYVVATCRVSIYLPVDRNSYMNRHA